MADETPRWVEVSTDVFELTLPDGTKVRVSQPKALFFRFMHWVTTSGLLARMRPPTAKLYLAIGCCADFRDNTCAVSSRVLAAAAGIGHGAVFRGLRELEGFGLVRKVSGKRAGGKCANVANAFELVLSPSPNPCPPRAQGLSPDRGDPCPPRAHKQEIERSAVAGAAAGLRFALADAGIGEPTQTKLAGLEGLTPEVVRRVAAQVKAARKGTGVLVLELQAEADRELARVKAAKQKAQAERERRAEAERLRADDERKAAADRERITKTREILEAMPEPERAQVIHESMAHLKHRSRRDPMLVDWAALMVADYMAKRPEVTTCAS